MDCLHMKIVMSDTTLFELLYTGVLPLAPLLEDTQTCRSERQNWMIVDVMKMQQMNISMFNRKYLVTIIRQINHTWFSIAILTLIAFSHDDVFKWNHLPRYWPFVPLTKASDAKLWCFLWSAPE